MSCPADVTARIFYPGETDYLEIEVTTNVTLGEQPVSVSFDHCATWRDAEWTGSPGTTRVARYLLDASTLTKPSQAVYLRFVDDPTTPVVLAGYVNAG